MNPSLPESRASTLLHRVLRLVGILTLTTAAVAASVPVVPLPDDPACTPADRVFMSRANELAAAASGHGNGSYGAVLVKNGKIILEFEACSTTASDPTQHAETGLIALASRTLGRGVFDGAILYTSTEPCIMCCGAIRAGGLKEFVYGTTAIQVTRLRGAQVPANPLECREIFSRGTQSAQTVIRGPLMEAEGLAIHAVHLARVAR